MVSPPTQQRQPFTLSTVQCQMHCRGIRPLRSHRYFGECKHRPRVNVNISLQGSMRGCTRTRAPGNIEKLKSHPVSRGEWRGVYFQDGRVGLFDHHSIIPRFLIATFWPPVRKNVKYNLVFDPPSSLLLSPIFCNINIFLQPRNPVCHHGAQRFGRFSAG